jgi:hypothetical protein
MKGGATLSKPVSSSSSRRHKYTKVLDNRKHPIRGPWRRNGSFYARITVEDDCGRSASSGCLASLKQLGHFSTVLLNPALYPPQVAITDAVPLVGTFEMEFSAKKIPFGLRVYLNLARTFSQGLGQC